MLREFITKLDADGDLVRVHQPISRHLEAAGLLKALAGRPVLLEHIKESAYPVVGNVFSSRALIARALGCAVDEIVGRLAQAIEHPIPPAVVPVGAGPCQEVVEP